MTHEDIISSALPVCGPSTVSLLIMLVSRFFVTSQRVYTVFGVVSGLLIVVQALFLALAFFIMVGWSGDPIKNIFGIAGLVVLLLSIACIVLYFSRGPRKREKGRNNDLA